MSGERSHHRAAERRRPRAWSPETASRRAAGIIINQLPTVIEELTAASYLIEKAKLFANQPAPPT